MFDKVQTDNYMQHNLPIKIHMTEDEDEDCNVVDDQEEAIDALKARQVDDTIKLKENQSRSYEKISDVEY